MTKQVKQLDRVIIRFAGDSGDGMQLTGDRFTQETAAFGNDLSTLPNFPAEIRAPRARFPASRRSRCTSPTTTSSPGRRPRRAGGDEPGRAEGQRQDLPQGATIIVDTHDFTARNLGKAGYDANPLRGRLRSTLQVTPSTSPR